MIRACALTTLLATLLVTLLTALLLLPTAATAQTVIRDVPRPGTFNDVSMPLKPVADGPSRVLIRLNAPAVPKPMIVADISARKTP